MGNRPLIGITTERFLSDNPENPARGEELSCLRHTYLRAVHGSGGLPVVLPIEADESTLDQYLDLIGGLVVIGNANDIDPDLYGEEPLARLGPVDNARCRFEMAMTRRALERDLPFLGICGGHQVLNVALGGTLFQDIASQLPNTLSHRQRGPITDLSHRITLDEGDHLLRAVFDEGRPRVNSYHHQSIKEPAKGLRVIARAEDGMIEAVQSEEHRFVLGVQWHPERLFPHDPPSVRLFQTFVAAVRDGCPRTREG